MVIVDFIIHWLTGWGRINFSHCNVGCSDHTAEQRQEWRVGSDQNILVRWLAAQDSACPFHYDYQQLTNHPGDGLAGTTLGQHFIFY